MAHPPGGYKEKLKRPKWTELLTTVGISCIGVPTLIIVYLKLNPSTENCLTAKIVTVDIFNFKIYNLMISCHISLDFTNHHHLEGTKLGGNSINSILQMNIN